MTFQQTAGVLSSLNQQGRSRLCNARVPACLLVGDGLKGADPDRDGSLLVDLHLDGEDIVAVTPAGLSPPNDFVLAIDLGGRHLWPLLVDVHTHLDKGHMVDRAPDSQGTVMGAILATASDRVAHWTYDDLIRRMEFGLATAYAHGVGVIRTHLDSLPEQAKTTWAAFQTVNRNWGSRIALQAVALVGLDVYLSDHGRMLADIVEAQNGLLGGFLRVSEGGQGSSGEETDHLLDVLFRIARGRNLDVDLHVDEAAVGDHLPAIARATMRHGYEGRVTCGHCCSLALLDDEAIAERVTLLSDAGVNIVSLPTVNMYLQDRDKGRTPRWRGVTPVKELREGGVRVAVAGDNCRDTFYAYGDHDMLDTWRQAVKILHLDHPHGDAASLAASVPAEIMGQKAGRIAVGGKADFMILDAWTMDQVLARPHADRIIIRRGAAANAPLPSYELLR